MNLAKRDFGMWKQRRSPRSSPALKLIGAGSSQREVRSFCPFCGGSDPSPENPCCAEWKESEGAEARVAAPPVSPRGTLRHFTERATARLRLGQAANLLVALLASSIVAAAFSIATQWKISADRASDLEAAQTLSREVATAMQEVTQLQEAHLRSLEASRATEAAPDARGGVAPAPAVPARTDDAPVATTEPVVPPPEARPEPAAPSAPAAASSQPRSAAGPSTKKPEEIPPPASASAPEQSALRPAQAPKPLEPAVVSRAVALIDPEELAKWRRLRRGMSRAAVHALLGDPKWMDRSLSTEFWLYSEDTILGRGWVAFYEGNGPVFSWREP